jgi:hypothetical protein
MQKLNEGPYEANIRELQAQLEGIKTTAQRGSTPAIGGEKARREGMARCKGHNHKGRSIEQGRQENLTRDKVAIGTRILQTPRRQKWIKGLKRRILRRVTEYQKLDLVEGSTPSETKKGAGIRGGAGNVEAPGSPWSE